MQVQAAALIIPSSSSSSKPSQPNPTHASPRIAISPDDDPNPSWTFYPPSAAYIPPASSTTGPISPSPNSPSSPTSPRSSSPPPPDQSPIHHDIGYGLHTNSHALPSSSSTPSTHHRILDHCFHVSIETRLQQAEAQYLASTQEQAQELQHQQQHQIAQGHQDDWQRRQRVLVDEAAVLGRKGSNVEAIVDGILKSHRSSGPLQTLPRHLKHRLHLCQLTSMVFGRFDVASSTNNSAGLNVYSAFHSRRHGASRVAIKQRFSHTDQGKQLHAAFSQPISSSDFCRRHHRRECKRTCCTLAKLQQEQQQALELKKKMANNYFMSNSVRLASHNKQDGHHHQRVTGLVDAIPAFLKCSAMQYRDIAQAMVDRGEMEELKEIKVEEGWYRLLLELMTQAVIESYLCDENTGFDTILDVFSFGDDPENTEAALKDFTMNKNTSTSTSNSNSTSPSPPPSPLHGATGLGMESLHLHSLSGQMSSTMLHSHYQPPHPSINPPTVLHDVTTQDRQDDILFAKTDEYKAFKAAKDKRLYEFLALNGATMDQHFSALSSKYPLIVFERQMTHFIARSQKLLVDPKLSLPSGDHPSMGLLIPPTTSAYADGSLSMPVSEDDDEEEEEDEEMAMMGAAVSERIKLEEIKEEEEEEEDSETINPTSKKRHSPMLKKESSSRSPSPSLSPMTVVVGVPKVVVVHENGTARSTGSTSMDEDDADADIDDDDHSTAARVVQVSKKHRHQHHHHQHHHPHHPHHNHNPNLHHFNDHGNSAVTVADDAGHALKKVKI